MNVTASPTRDELVKYYSLRGVPVPDIQCILRRVHGYAIRFKSVFATPDFSSVNNSSLDCDRDLEYVEIVQSAQCRKYLQL